MNYEYITETFLLDNKHRKSFVVEQSKGANLCLKCSEIRLAAPPRPLGERMRFPRPTIVILWILHHVSTASFLHPDPPLSPLGSDLHKFFLESILVPSAIVPSYNMDLTTTSKPTFYRDLH